MTFPAHTQSSNVNFKVPRPLLTPPALPYPPPEEFTNKQDVESWIIVSLIVLGFLALFEATVDKCIAQVHIQTEEDDPDLETGQIPAAAIIVSDLNDFHDHSWVIEIVERLRESLAERRGERLRALEELLPLVDYGKVEQKASSGDCAICLESFQDEESCRVFPDCSHIFHSACIYSWLENHLTCPICRNRCNLNV